jgi:flavin reductase (DIM6/NTAB) family NADH-FMN oxidoreductase RutF
MKIKKKNFPLGRVYQLLEPGPVVMVSTALKDKANIMTMSWHMMIDFEPPLVGCVVSDRNFSFDILKKTKECVINIPDLELAAKVVGIGNTTGAKIDKFEEFKLTAEPAQEIKAPLVAECFANLECKVIDTSMTSKYGIFILEVVKAWISTPKKNWRMIHHLGNGNFVADGDKFKLFSKKK